MALNINSNTVIRLIVRRGTDLERQYATLSLGELGYTVDTKRLFIGDGVNQGGVVAGNKFLGTFTSINDVSQVQVGDTAYDSTAKIMYAFESTTLVPAGEWVAVGNNVTFGESFAGTGFNYALSSTGLSNIYNQTDAIELDSTFWSLCATRGPGARPGGFYFGPITSNTWDVDAARAAFDGPVFINGNSTTQIQLSAGPSAIVNFASNGGTGVTTFKTPSAFIFTASNSTGTSAQPGFVFSGNTSSGAMLVQGNLFVQGSAFFAATPVSIVATTVGLTALSADTTGHPSLTALTLSNGDAPSHGTVLINVKNSTSPIIYVDTSPWVGINTKYSSAYSSYKFVVSGASLFTNTLTVSGETSVVGNISATGDIIAFSSSDAALKNNITPITGALDKLLAIQGVEFDWNSKSSYSGHDIGVIAQAVEPIIPSAVKSRHDGYKSVNYEKIIPLMIEAIRELKNDPNRK